MAFEYVNRKGDTYFLHAGTTRTGNPRYWLSRKSGDSVIDAVPPGYEVYEKPENDQVLLRKAKPSRITAAERELLVNAVRRDAGLEHCRVDIEGDNLVIYTPTLEEKEADRLLDLFQVTAFRKADSKDWLLKRSDLCKMMRFTLADPEARLFELERWCFRGAIDNWFFLDGPKPLADLARRYVKHLGKESFFELL
jgi:hypothetical protein